MNENPAAEGAAPEHRSGFVSFVGRPNAGKSTLTNALVGQKVVITSNKPQTTRTVVRGIVHRPDAQLILVDTPGLHRPRTLLGERLNDMVRESLGDVDVVLTPVLTHTTPQIGYLAADLDFETHLERVSAYVGFTPLHNVTGAPAISLPLGRTSDGRPIGVMIQARRGQDRMLLELAHELEAAAPFARVWD